MPKIYEARFHYSLNGRNVNNSHTTTFRFRSELAKGAAGFHTLNNNVAGELAKIMTNKTQLLRAVISEVRTPTGSPIPRGNQTTTYLTQIGLRTAADGVNGAIVEKVASFGKTASYGDPGIQHIRGCFFDGDTVDNDGGNLSLKSGFVVAPFNAFPALLIAVFTNASCPLILPAPKNEDFITGARLVTSMPFQGVGLLQRNNNRRSTAEEEDDLIKRGIKALARAYDKASRDENGNAVAVVGAVLDALVQQLFLLVTKYTLARILRYTLPAPVRILVNALPALTA